MPGRLVAVKGLRGANSRSAPGAGGVQTGSRARILDDGENIHCETRTRFILAATVGKTHRPSPCERGDGQVTDLISKKRKPAAENNID